ncbi:M15 family metallopeptidase [Streptomyces griseus]|uniref:M15 family metallopeptidase n=1 Tax=Streptomyces griseus TaxID=1911 RepID=UPI0005639E13|nr:M15 family metallopeptidase [Streptomyces griseus]
MAATRRHFLRSAVTTAVAAGAVAGTAPLAPAAEKAPPAGTAGTAGSPGSAGQAGRTSANGWPIPTAPPDADGSVWTCPVPGTGFGIEVAIGDVEAILVHVVRRFHYEVETLRAGDVTGYRSPATTKGYETNHASGTAIDIRPDAYPPGAKGGFFAPQLAVIRAILADTEGVVTWGGDFPHPDESHFQIDVPPTSPKVKQVADRIRTWNTTPGRGAGVTQDPRNRS